MAWRPFSSRIVKARRRFIEGRTWIPGDDMAQTIDGHETQGWQVDAWRIWKCVGEVHYPTTHLARQIGRLNWDVDIDSEQVPEDVAEEVLAEVTAGMGVRDATIGMALNLQVAGELWYVETAPRTFNVYSVVTPKLDQIVKEAKAAGRIARRIFFPDPTNPKKADSAMRTAIAPAEELLTLSALSRAQSRSRIAQAGILGVNSRLQVTDADPFGADLTRAMMAAIRDVDHPSAVAPIKVDIPDDLMEGGTNRWAQHLLLDRPYDNRIAEKIERATKRVAIAMDFDPVLLSGSESANHWALWLSSLETYTSHLEPPADLIGEALADIATELLLRDVGVEAEVKIKPNAKELLAKRSTVRDALDAAKLGAVGLQYVREAIGAREEDAPTEDDLEILRLIPRETGREPMVDEGTTEVEPGAVAAAVYPLRHRDRIETAALSTAGAMSVAVATCRAKVGAKVRTAVRSSSDHALIDGVPNSDVVAHLGDSAGVDVSSVVWDGLTPFMEWWSREQPTTVPCRTAAIRVGMLVMEGLSTKSADLGPIAGSVVGEVLTGSIGGSDAA